MANIVRRTKMAVPVQLDANGQCFVTHTKLGEANGSKYICLSVKCPIAEVVEYDDGTVEQNVVRYDTFNVFFYEDRSKKLFNAASKAEADDRVAIAAFVSQTSNGSIYIPARFAITKKAEKGLAVPKTLGGFRE